MPNTTPAARSAPTHLDNHNQDRNFNNNNFFNYHQHCAMGPHQNMTLSANRSARRPHRTSLFINNSNIIMNTKTTTKSTLALVALLLFCTFTLLLIGHTVDALQCYCNVCPVDTCVTASEEKESSCFKSVQKVFVQENDTYALETTYGCLSGGEGLLAHLQCHVNRIKHNKPTFITCCRDADYCNELLPDPNEDEDPRWKITKLVDNRPNQLISYTSIMYLILLWIVGAVILITLFAIYRKCFKSRSSNDSKSSRYALQADIENLHRNYVASSSAASTHSCSMTEDSCQKPTESNHEDTFIPEDLTSGLGERMLNQRTMAREIGMSKTDHVGNGRFGRVFRGVYHGEDVAVKAFRTIDQDSWKREDTIFRTLNHDNIVRFIASEVTTVENGNTEIWMFLEYCPYGSLCDYLDEVEILGPQQAIKILFSIINGLNYLHEDYAQGSRQYKPSIAHRDIKSKNILMKTPESCCIADFGHALVKIDEETLDYGKYQHLQVGTVRYMAPEILRPNPSLNYNQFSVFAQADLYQFGLILWEVCHRTALDVLHPAGVHKLPYDGVVPQNPGIQDMVKIVCEDHFRPPRYESWDQYPAMKRLADLMVECWRPNPRARMETLGVKKKLKSMFDKVVPQIHPINGHPYYGNFSLSPSSRTDRTRSQT